MAEVDFPIHDPNRKLASVPLVHDHINERLLTAIRDLLPKQTLTFSGEVLRVRRSRRQWFFTVRGGEDADPRLGLQMILPIAEREPMCGQMIRVMGHLDARARDRGQIEIVVEGLQRCDEGVLAARYRKQIEALESLRAKIGHAQVLDLHRPVSGKVGLITGRVADAGADFERGLNQPGERYPIAVRPFKASLDDPTAIAEVIRSAAADDEVEVIAIVRGGGDPLGIHMFDDPLVLEAIAEAVTKKFVVMGVGHADDWSASEELASHVEDVPQSAGNWLRRRHRQLYWQQRQRPAQRQAAPPLQAKKRRWVELAWRWLAPVLILAVGVAAGWTGRPMFDGSRDTQAGAVVPSPPTRDVREVAMPEVLVPRSRPAPERGRPRNPKGGR